MKNWKNYKNILVISREDNFESFKKKYPELNLIHADLERVKQIEQSDPDTVVVAYGDLTDYGGTTILIQAVTSKGLQYRREHSE
jgi:predicted GTPase